ncbi:MAG: LL-diaminopimelate aminotransferase [Candidatus Omnitrophota bacterium]|nr:LL-diaminopimelate aminotransferase [Candidatus Omnitrophota bacterium]
MIHEANRLKRLPPYLFTIIDSLKREVKAQGTDIIDLGMGNPDQGAPDYIVEELCRAARMKSTHRYSRFDDEVEQKLRQAIANRYKDVFNVDLDPQTEVLPLIGSKEGIAHLSLSFLNNDDIALVPSPAYPVHFNGVIMAGGILYNIPLKKENGFKPDLRSLGKEIVKMSKLLFLSYPHNPTAAVVDLGFFKEMVAWARSKDIIIGHDLAYSDIVFDGYKAPSILQVKGAKKMGIEFHTLSKSYNMAGWRIGYCVGNADILKVLAKTKSYIDFGMFQAVQWAAIKALNGPQDCVKQAVQMYQLRRDVLVDNLRKVGWDVERPKATFYVWAHIPLKYSALTSMEFTSFLLKETGVVVAPGIGFGEYGEGYIRFALVEPEDRIKEAVNRIGKLLKIES